MSRGIDTIETVSVVGSSETTIIVSVRYVRRPTPASTPMIRPLIRAGGGRGRLTAKATATGTGSGGAEARLLGSGSGSMDGPTAIGEGSTKISSAASRPVSVR